MRKRLQNIALALLTVLGIGVFSALPAGAIDVFKDCPAGSTTAVCEAKEDTVEGPAQTVISVLLIAIGIVSVIMIIIGGIRYTLSNGDASQIKSAKDTILYAIIGLIVAMLAYSIVNFVVGRF
jgi:hypothetical protein